MTDLNWLIIGVWLCGLAASACTLAVVLFIRQNQRITSVLEAQLKSLGDTHLRGFEIVANELNTLRARVEALEEQ